ncbi:MAG: hypothetical protein GF329_19530 [Candidatus Lokiarchaeota archaeon]|nr:hypothetical protein [Candidatus Lokiarchaeota archaeon]
MNKTFKNLIKILNRLTGSKYPEIERIINDAMNRGDIPFLTDFSKLLEDIEYNFLLGNEAKKVRTTDRKIKELTLKYSDLKNLDHLMVIHESGVSMYNYSFAAKYFDANLISGFLTAIDSFRDASKIKKSNNKNHTGFELKYADFIVLLNPGNKFKVALIMDEKPSPSMRLSLLEFTNKFESEYKREIENFRGNLTKFENADKIVKVVFQSTLLFPHRIKSEINIEELKQNLNNVQKIIIDKAYKLQKEVNYFLLSSLIEEMEESNHNIQLENILENFCKLKKSGALICFSMEEMDEVLEKEIEKESIFELTNTLEDDEIISPMVGVPQKHIDKVNEHLRNTSFLFQRFIIDELIGIPKTEKTKYLKDRFKHWSKKDKDKEKIKRSLQDLREKGDKYKIIYEMTRYKELCEELGYEETADKISNEISRFLNDLKMENIKLYDELRESFNKSLTKYIEKAEKEIIEEKFLRGALLYKKAMRISIYLGDQDTVKYLEKLISNLGV